MQHFECHLLTSGIFGSDRLSWQRLNPLESSLFQLPAHLQDQVFRVAMADVPAGLILEILVSEQCPKDAYHHIVRCICKNARRPMVFNLIHARSAQAHLVFWRPSFPRAFRHWDVDFNHLHASDQAMLDGLKSRAPSRWNQVFHGLERGNDANRFFRTLRGQLNRVTCHSEQAYFALVDLVLKLIFLIFVQRKGWLNFDPFYMETKMTLCQTRGLAVVHAFLAPLFARLEGVRIQEPIPLGQLPHLGGGLFVFDPSKLPRLDNAWCGELFQTLITSFNFSLFEPRRDRRIVGISPEVLGHVFEQLLHHRDRKVLGTFFTPLAIAEKQVQASFDAYLDHQGLQDHPDQLAERLVTIRVLDPTCGSGTYLVAAFQVLLQWRLKFAPEAERYNGKLFKLKRGIVTKNLYGIDIHPLAVRLTEVRLWLNMIQDLEITEPERAPALPNLQHHLRAGDFLNQYAPTPKRWLQAWPKYDALLDLRRKFPTSNPSERHALLKHMWRLEGELSSFLLAREANCENQVKRNLLSQRRLPGMKQEDRKALDEIAVNREPLHLPVVFSHVWQEGGFDLILGNPPWRSATQLGGRHKQRILAQLPKPLGLHLDGQVDLSLYFVAASLELLRPGGQLGFLLPGKVAQARFAAGLRAFLRSSCTIDYVFDYGFTHNQVFKADTFPLAIGITLGQGSPERKILVESHQKDKFRSFMVGSEDWLTARGAWNLGPPEAIRMMNLGRDWPSLRTAYGPVRRGLVTGAKKHFVFHNKPSRIPVNHSRPLLRGRDIQNGQVAPGAWIYWPFHELDWFERLDEDERLWLASSGSLRRRGGQTVLPYGPKEPRGRWLLAWRYLAKRWQATLLDSRLGWVLDQTVYYLEFHDFTPAYRMFLLANSDYAAMFLNAVAERGKDGYRFFYAHTCEQLPIPPELETWAVAEERSVWMPGDAQDILESRVLGEELFVGQRVEACR